MTDERLRLSGYPTGWFAVAFSSELPRGAVLRRKAMGRELVVFRTESGAPVVMDAHCPHLGAHLGEGGCVVGETIRCPFHGFAFAVDGTCVATPYPAARAGAPHLRTRPYPVQEAFGAVLCFVGDDAPWTIADVEPEHAARAWSPPATRAWRIRTHVQEIYENTVDIGHFSPVHGYAGVEVKAPFEFEGPHMRAQLQVTRARGIFGPLQRAPMRMDLAIATSGLGHSRVQVTTSLGLELRTVVMATPIDEEYVDARVSVQVAELGGRFVPQSAIARLVSRVALREMARDFERDLRIWENKRYVQRPGVVRGDGPIGAYRKWARQFFAHEKASLPIAVGT